MNLGQIYAQMRDWFQGSGTSASDFTAGSVLRTLFEAVAVPIEELFYRLYVTLPKRYFLSKAEDDADVDELAADHTFGAVTRSDEKTAKGTVLFTGNAAGIVIPSGAIFLGQDNGLRYTADQEAITGADKTIEFAVTCTVEGSKGNLQPGRSMSMPAPIPGLVSVVVGANGIGGGADRENNPTLKKRVQDWFGTIQTGTPAAIIRQALGVPGVKRAFFKGGVPQPGWWTCYVDDGSGGASASIRQAVYDALLPHVDAEMIHEVKAGTVLSISMEVSLVTSAVDGATLTAIRTAAEAAILRYLDSLGYEDSVFNDRVGVAVDSADERILSVVVTFTSPTEFQAEQLLQVLYEDPVTGRQEMRNPLRGTLFRAGTITFT